MYKTITLPEKDWYKIQISANSWDTALDKILKMIVKNPGKKNLAFLCSGDGLITEFDKLSLIVDRISNNTRIPIKNMLLVIGSVCCINTFNTYKKCIKDRGWKPIRLATENNWEILSAKTITDEFTTIFDSSPRIKSKLLLCYNGQIRPERGFILAKLIQNNLLENSYVSANQRINKICMGNTWLTKDGGYGSDHRNKTGLTPELTKILLKHAHLFPLKLSYYATPSDNQIFHNAVNDYAYFNDSYFSLITETIYYKLQFLGHGHLATPFLTEKTYKVIAAKHPFIIVHRPNILALLREDGYKTFSPYIDETYDLIENDASRLNYIMDEVIRLSKYTNEQWLEFQENVQHIVEHNFNLLKSKKLKSAYKVLENE